MSPTGRDVLTVHTAELVTAAVEVKTLTVRGKQVTLALFRQLHEEPLITDDGSLAGIPWGRVNYHPDKCDRDGHMHVVWQKGYELRRATVATTIRWECFTNSAGDEFTSIQFARHVIGIAGEFWDAKFKGRAGGVTPWTVKEFPHIGLRTCVVGAACDLRTPPDRWDYDCCYARALPNVPEWRGEASVEATRTALAAAYDKVHASARAAHDFLFGPGSTTEDDAWAALIVAVADEDVRRRRILSATAALGELPQIFIAT